MSTVTCLDVRRLVGAEPNLREPGVLEHCKVCASCAGFVREMQVLESHIERAFKVEVPEGLEARIALDGSLRHARRTWQRPWLAAAASVLMVLGIGITSYLHRHPQGQELSAAVVDHIVNPEEVTAIGPDQSLIHDASLVTDAMDGAGVQVHVQLAGVSYAHTCLFRGERVVHLVVQGEHGPVTILLLPHIHVDASVPVDEQGFHGVIVPDGEGSIAIVTNNATPVEPMEQELAGKVSWSL